MMPDVACRGNEGYSLGRLVSGGSVHADGTPVMAMASGQGDATSWPMTGAQVGNDAVWLVTF